MTKQAESLPLAWLARHDGSVIVGHGPFEAAKQAPSGAVAFYIQDFASASSTPWWIPRHHETLSQEEFSRRFPPAAEISYQWHPPDAAPFSEVFQEVMSSIHEGAFEKTVPVVTEIGIASSNPGRELLACMARLTPPLQPYGFMRDQSGFAGATPELLFSLSGQRLTTMALAGTARSEDRDVFAVDEKEIREHEYVAQTLVAKLLELGSLKRGTRQILDLGPIVHFLTPIEVELHQAMAPQELLRRLHPTPALGPLPRTDTTMAQLLTWRQRLGCPPGFGAPFGVWDHGRFDSIVSIRGVWWNGQQVQIPAGCGIIEASRLVNEWRELRLKREAVKRFLSPL